MKKIVLFTMVLLTLGACKTTNSHEEIEERKQNYAALLGKPTSITFEEDGFDFGTVKDGEMVHHTFKFTNTGEENLVLINVKGSCGCTVPENWPKNPIQPGGTGEIEVSFDSKNRVGNVVKNVRIEANTDPSITVLKITGVVEEKL